MAKKRKASGHAAQAPAKVSAKLAIKTYEDVANSEDEFHLNRDKVMLDDGPEAKRRRKWQEDGKSYPENLPAFVLTVRQTRISSLRMKKC